MAELLTYPKNSPLVKIDSGKSWKFLRTKKIVYIRNSNHDHNEKGFILLFT